MIHHIVLLPFNTNMSEQEINVILDKILKLKEVIPEIKSVAVGKNNSPEGLDRGYMHGLHMQFESDADRAIYIKHPTHVELAEKEILPALVDGINSPVVFDYEL